VPSLNLHRRQPLPKGWRWGAVQRGPGWIGSWVCGPGGRSLVVRFAGEAPILTPGEIRTALIRASNAAEHADKEVDRAAS
jgi:hypothetical protein